MQTNWEPQSSAPRSRHLVVFALEDRQYALPLAVVERLFRLVEITPLPKAPRTVLGVINVAGRIVPVISLRERLRLPDRAPHLSDWIILARTARRTLALLIEGKADVIEHGGEALVAAGEILPELEQVDGVVKLPDGLVLILDLDTFLALESQALEHQETEEA